MILFLENIKFLQFNLLNIFVSFFGGDIPVPYLTFYEVIMSSKQGIEYRLGIHRTFNI